MDPSQILPFVLATLVFTVTPGPGSLYCGAQSLAFGTRAGLRAAAGLHIGGYVHVFAAAFGLSIVLETIPFAFAALKLIGAGILIWMGAALILKRLQNGALEMPKAQRAGFGKAFLVEAVNPTTALFFLAFLPQFVSPDAAWPIWLQFIVLGTVTGVAFSASDLVYALAAGRLHRRLAASTRLRTLAQRIGGGVLIGLGVKLAVTRSA
ncbi:MAG: LysE family translocator [Pseudomonadota bacterium]